MGKDDTIRFSDLSDTDMNETALINYIKQNLNNGLDYIYCHNSPDMIGYKKGLRHSMQVMDSCLEEYKKEKMIRLKRIWENPCPELRPIKDKNQVINLIARVANISGRVGLIRRIANEYEDHIDDVLDELDELITSLMDNLDDA